ncbi:DNA polymerase III subunit gamma/tau [Candidatus Pelagibacter sp.]|nr:DNA polymerase III subunit gamma/tau [Candidatus Pelagibacter sp.]
MSNNSKVLALKYRPQVFKDLIGQNIIVETIEKSISQNKIPNAFLFTGIRGVGKTTIARILAKSLNCGNSEKHNCLKNKCKNCDEISESRHIDVLEMDAASKTGVDDVRDLIEFSRYGPTSSKFKIFIIDEVHMLSKQAFNALLKTLEEPPAYLKFIFATTEVNKIPVTVLSRCQRFDLSRIKSEELSEFLAKVAEMEKIDINQDVISLISKISEGSVRDALSLLDRISLTNDDSQKGTISLESAREIFGYFDKEFTINLIETIFDGDEDKTLDLYRQIYQKGIEPKIFLNGFLEIIYYLKNFKNLERVSFSTDLTENNFKKIKEMSEKLDAHTLLLFWQFTIETMDEVNIVNDPNLSVEMFLIRLLYLKGNQTKTDIPASNQNNKIDNNFEKKKIAVNQLKSSSQEKQKKILEENKSINNLEIKSFNDLVNICNSKKEVELKYELETNVNLINFKNGYIEISFNENLKKDFVKILSSKLYEWTNTRWIISLSQNKGQETIKKTSEGEKKNNLKDFEQTDIFNNIKNSFPDAELIDVKDNKDD